MTTPGRRRLLVVDDNAVDREQIRRMVGTHFDLVEAASAGAGLAAAADASVDCVLLDYRLPDRDGTEVLGSFAAMRLPVIMLTALGNESVAVEAMKHGAMDYLRKGYFDRDALWRSVDSAIDRTRLANELDQQRAALHVAMEELRARHEDLERVHALSERRAHDQLELLSQVPAVVWRADEQLERAVFSGAAREAWLAGGDGEAIAHDVRIDEVPAWQECRPHPLDAHRRALAGTPAEFEIAWAGRVYNARLQVVRHPDGRPAGVVGAAFDTTGLRLLERQLRTAAALEAVGRVCTSIAHDFNNLLQAVMNAATFAAGELPPDHPAQSAVGDVMNAAKRGAALTRSIVAVVRPGGSRTQPVVVNEAVRAALPMLKRLVGPSIVLEFDASPEPWLTRVVGAGIDQLLLNLVVNARDAMPDGGRITVRARNLRRDEGTEWICLTVQDSGTGISEAVLVQVFEPFFTTKGEGRGSGLGLATCRDVAQAAGGSIRVSNADDGGTLFEVLLPRFGG